MPATYQFLLAQQDGGVLTLTMNRPEVLNALNATLIGELGDEIERAAADTSVRCIVLTGAGRAFGSGQDLNDFATLYQSPGPIVVSEHLAKYHRILLGIQRAPKPVIAAVRGVAAGASCNLALACDLRVAADDARFIEAFARIGLVPDAGGGYLLTRLVGLGKAMELAMLTEEVRGPEAARLGLVNRCVPAADFDATVRDLATKLANGPTVAYRLIKEQMYRSADSDMATALRIEGELQDIAINTADHRESVTAFLEKRPPRYEGK